MVRIEAKWRKELRAGAGRGRLISPRGAHKINFYVMKKLLNMGS